MTLLPFQIESITVVNTGLGDYEVENIEWINDKRLRISNEVECVYDDGSGGTCVSLIKEFEWSFKERDFIKDAYVFIVLVKQPSK